MKVLHLMVAGGTGGIEVLIKNYSNYSSLDNTFLFAWGGGAVADEMKDNGRRCIILDKERIGNVGVVKEILRLCREEEFDVLVTHYAAPLLRYAAVIAELKFPHLKIISYMHSNAADIYTSSNYIKRLLTKRAQILAMRKSEKVIAISESVKESIIAEFKIPSDSISVIYNGVPLDAFSHTKQHLGELRVMELIYVGRLIEDKGVQNIITGLKRCVVPFHFTIVGDGPYRSALERLAEGMNVEFLGMRTDIPELLSQADIFIHLPKWEEGFGITVVEAMAAGKICICGKRGALPEIVDDCENGFLIEDEKELRDLLAFVAKMSCYERRKIQNAARDKAKRFSIERYAATLDTLVENTK